MMTTLRTTQGAQDSIVELLRHLMAKEHIRGVLALRRLGNSGAMNYELITKCERLDEIEPFHPVMPANAGRLLSKLTLNGAFDEPIAAVLRPCELRAFVELVKRQQGDPTNILTISSTCAGVLPLESSVHEGADTRVAEYWAAVDRGDLPDGIRPSCRICEYPVPFGADVVVRLVGEGSANSGSAIAFRDEKTAKLADGMPGELQQATEELAEPETIRSLRASERETQRVGLEASALGLDGLIETFALCTNCHGCSAVCPICYCQLCEFESSRSGFKPERYESELQKKGAAKVPPGTLAFHMGRMAHMAMSCVGCGMCTDVCPAAIPVASLFQKVGRGVQELFDYIPGRDVDEAIPLTTFMEQELEDIG